MISRQPELVRRPMRPAAGDADSRAAALRARVRFTLVLGSVAALLSPGALAAQESIFGQVGFGVPEDGLSVRSRGMGNVSTALPQVHFTFRNAASLAVFDRSGISIAGLFQTRTPEDLSGESTQNSAEVPFLQLAFPLGADFVLGGGAYRYLDFDGFVDTSTPFQGDSLPVRLTTEGGISVLSPQLAHYVSPLLRVGGGVDFYTGSRERRREIEFDPGEAVSTSDSVGHSFRAVGFSVGVHVAPVERLLLGAGYRSGVTLEGKLEVGPGIDPADGGEDGGDGMGVEDTGREVRIELPATLYAGASYRVDPRLTVAGELETANWGDFAVDGQTVPDFHDVLGVGLGAEYSFPNRVFFLPEGSVLRAGVRTRTLPQRFGGRTVREQAFTLGLGQVVGIGASNLDLSLEVGKRGSLSENAIQESFLRLGVAFSAFEQWTSRTPRPTPE